MKALTVNIKNIYGQNKVYPVCETSKLIARLSEKKTLTERNIRIIKQLGYTLKQQQQTI